MLLRDLHIPLDPPTLWCDNLSAIALSSNPVFHAWSKHIEVDYHFVHERVASKQLLIKHLATADQIADILTKPLPVSRFTFLQHKLLAHSSPVSLPGHVKQNSVAAFTVAFTVAVFTFTVAAFTFNTAEACVEES